MPKVLPTTTTALSFQVGTTDPAAELGFEAWFDDRCLLNLDWVQESVYFQHDFTDDDAEHQLRFVLKNKKIEHTEVDDDGNIVKDARLTVTDLAFDEIKLGHMLTELAVYTHDFNGTADVRQDRFYNELGCNGTVSLNFNTPIYLWLLENM
jgi:hypothetical protein